MSAAASVFPDAPVGQDDAASAAGPTVGQLAAALEAQVRRTEQLASRLEALSRRLDPPPASGAAAPVALPELFRSGARLLDEPAAESRRARAAVYCFGSFALFVDGTPVDGWRAGKTRALLQYLVTHHDRPVPREALIAALWPNPDAAAAGTSLKVAVHALRQALARLDPLPGERYGTAALSIQAHDAGYQLSASGLWLDVEAFERNCVLGRRLEAQGCADEALALFARAAALYRGDFLADVWDDWVVFRREGLKDQYLFAVARLADAALAAGDYEDCITRCQQLLAHDRCREDTYRTLMVCHARLGQRDRVRRWFELGARTLRAELGVEPEPGTVHLYQTLIRASGCVPSPPAAAAAPAVRPGLTAQ
jgi:DNA-binding SARP family transcriptional activator